MSKLQLTKQYAVLRNNILLKNYVNYFHNWKVYLQKILTLSVDKYG